MRIVVVSDTHGAWGLMHSVVQSQPRADIIIHLGDNEEDMENVRFAFPEKMIVGVPGNNDYCSRHSSSETLRAEGRTIFYTHGHIYSVKRTLDRLEAAARERNADICLFGHTHEPLTDFRDGLYLLNPGSLGHPRSGAPTYGFVDITPAGIVTNIVKLSK